MCLAAPPREEETGDMRDATVETREISLQMRASPGASVIESGSTSQCKPLSRRPRLTGAILVRTIP